MKKSLYIYLMAIGLLCLPACDDNLPEEGSVKNEVKEGYADLTISMNVPSLSVSTRSIASDPKNTQNDWTTWEKFVDGALLYHVTLFVVDGEGKLVAYRDFYNGSDDIFSKDNSNYGDNGFYENYTEGTETSLWSGAVKTDAKTGVAVKATFKSSNPLHGNVEKLKPGNYKVIAVANYAPIDDNNKSALGVTETYAGLGNVAEDVESESSSVEYNGFCDATDASFTDFTTKINDIIGTNDADGNFAGVANFLANPLFAYKLNSGYDRVCKQLPQPLVMIRDVTLEGGKINQLAGKLSRTFARVRVEVKNNDESQYISVYGFNFENNYASRRAYLFNDIHKDATSINDAYTNFALYDETKGNIGVSSTDALIPLTAVNEGSEVRLRYGTNFAMFDCYILEGKITNKTAFSFVACYWTGGASDTATEERHITKFYTSEYTSATDGGRTNYGLLESNLFIRGGTVVDERGKVTKSTGAEELLKANAEAFADEGTVVLQDPNGTSTDIVLGTTVIAPEYIWQMTLNKTEAQVKEKEATLIYSSSGVGFETGRLYNLGTGLYLQSYKGEKDENGNAVLIPRLGETVDNTLIFKISLDPMYEIGTIFCQYDGTYYYLNYSSSGVIKWVKFTGTTLSESSTNHEYLTFETIGGGSGEKKPVTVSKPIDITTTTGTPTNEIVRNDFFYGIVPVSVSSSSANTSTTSE